MRLKDCKNSHFLALFYEFYFQIKSLENKQNQSNQNNVKSEAGGQKLFRFGKA
jgi:hypothetical protein